MGVYEYAANVVIDAGSNANTIVQAAHTWKVGDVVRFITTSNSLVETEATISKVVDANTVELSTVLSAALSTGDTVTVLRPIYQKFSSDGSQVVTLGTLASATYMYNGVLTEVTEDTAVAANNRGLPVKIIDIGGDINISADNINVQLAHDGATPDSVRIGNGTNLMAVNASLEASVVDAGANTKLDTVNTNLGTINTNIDAVEADIEAGNVLLGTIDADTGNIAGSTSSIDTKLTTTNSVLGTIDTDTGNIAVSTASIDTKMSTSNTNTGATATSVASLDTKTNANYGVATGAIRTAAQIGNASAVADFNTGAAGAQTLRVVLEATNKADLTSINTKLPAALGQTTMAGSLPVVLASNQSAIAVDMDGKSSVTTVRNDYSSVNVTSGAWVQLIASTGSAITEFDIFDSSGQTLELGTGAGGAESRLCLIFPGGNGRVPLAIAASTRVSIRAVSATASVGEIDINFYGL